MYVFVLQIYLYIIFIFLIKNCILSILYSICFLHLNALTHCCSCITTISQFGINEVSIYLSCKQLYFVQITGEENSLHKLWEHRWLYSRAILHNTNTNKHHSTRWVRLHCVVLFHFVNTQQPQQKWWFRVGSTSPNTAGPNLWAVAP